MRFLSGLILVLILCSCSTLQLSSTKEDNKPQIIKLERFRKALWKVHVNVQGKPGAFLFDTGGGITLFTDSFSRNIECDYWGSFTGYNMFGKRGDGKHCDSILISAGESVLTLSNVGKINFGDQFAGDKTPDGLLSLDAFDGKVLTIDQISGTLIIETQRSLKRRIKNMTEFPVRISRECSGRCLSVFIGIRTQKGMTWLLLDSGAGGVSLIAKDYAEVFGLDPEKKEQWLDYNIGPEMSISSPVIITDLIMDGNLGQPFMSKFIITLDLKNSRGWLQKVL